MSRERLPIKESISTAPGWIDVRQSGIIYHVDVVKVFEYDCSNCGSTDLSPVLIKHQGTAVGIRYQPGMSVPITTHTGGRKSRDLAARCNACGLILGSTTAMVDPRPLRGC